MHDIDRVLFEGGGNEIWEEGGNEMYSGEGDEIFSGEGDEVFSGEGDEIFSGESGQTYGELPGNTDATESGTYEYTRAGHEVFSGEGGLLESALRDEIGLATETSLATGLLEVTNEHELDRFLGDLVNTAVKAAKNFANSDAGRAVGGVLKSAAKQVLPQLGQAVGNYVAPGVGGQWGQSAGKWLGSKLELGLDLEGLSPEDRQFETAKAFVRFAGDTARLAARAPQSVVPATAARQAAIAAAQRNLPGLLAVPGGRTRRARSGRWIRRGHNIVIIGA